PLHLLPTLRYVGVAGIVGDPFGSPGVGDVREVVRDRVGDASSAAEPADVCLDAHAARNGQDVDPGRIRPSLSGGRAGDVRGSGRVRAVVADNDDAGYVVRSAGAGTPAGGLEAGRPE